MHMPAVELFVRVGLATMLGIAIGIERQWQSRMAGLQTMPLVSMGSALYVVLGAYTFGPETVRPRWQRHLRAWMTQTPRLIVTISAPTATYHERVLGEPVPNGTGIRDCWQSKVGILVSTDHLAADVLEEP